jgi:uncharacterized protein YcfL
MKTFCARVFTVMIALLMIGCSSWQEEPVFQKLVGIWETSAEIYQDCTVEITPDELIFAREFDREDRFRIHDMETTRSEKGLLVVLHLESLEGTRLKQRFYLIDEKGKLVMQTMSPANYQWVKRP